MGIIPWQYGSETAKSLLGARTKPVFIVSSVKRVKSSSLDPESNRMGRQIIT
jgi:hypothetical protein